jgi:serine protease Do
MRNRDFQYRALAALVAVIATLACAPSVGHAQDEVNGLFVKANEYAQARCAKIFGASIGRVEGYGTGIIVSPEGHILTAGGVMLSTERIAIVLPDGSRHQGKVERRSQNLQAALLKIDAQTPNYFDLGDPSKAAKGDWVLAVSNLFKVADGSEPLSVNLGVVSLRTALDARRGYSEIAYQGDVLLIDAITSNPGAAGGAVVDTEGKLVGMVGRIMEATDTGTRLNYAVPVDLLAKFYNGQPLDSDTVVKVPGGGKAYLGIKVFSLGVGNEALAYVDRVTPGSPGHKAGLRSDDLIIAIGPQTVRDVKDYKKIISTLTPGEEVIMLVKRKNDLVEIPLTPTAEEAPK